MKKIAAIFLSLTTCLTLMAGCGSSEENKELSEYKDSMESFFSTLEEIDTEINEIDPEADDSLESLYTEFDKLIETYSDLAALTAPTEGAPETFAYIDDLADQAYDYMVQADDYLNQSFDESSYNETTLNAALECYDRANKRVGYIIDLLHGELPQDETITYN